MIVIFVGAVLVFKQLQYTTFQKVYSNDIPGIDSVEKIVLTAYDLSGELPEREESITVEEEGTITKLMGDFEKIELKKRPDMEPYYKEFSVEILAANEIEENHILTKKVLFDLDEKCLNNYEIVSSTDHLQTIESLFEQAD